MTKTMTLCLTLVVCGCERGGGEDSDPAIVARPEEIRGSAARDNETTKLFQAHGQERDLDSGRSDKDARVADLSHARAAENRATTAARATAKSGDS
jgi:hypothetical protein